MDITISGTIEKHYNQSWPPKINSYVIASYDEKIFLGFIYRYMWEMKACIMILLNNLDYVEKILSDHNIVDSELAAKGIFILSPENGWKYVNIEKLAKSLNKTEKEITDITNEKINIFESKTKLNDYPVTSLDLTTRGIYIKHENKDKANDLDDGINTYLYNDNEEPNLGLNFRENEIDLFDTNEKFVETDEKTKQMLQSKLESIEKIHKNEIRIIVNKSIAVKNIITTLEDEINEGNKIIEWLNEKMTTNDIFNDLKMAIHNGYVHIGRKGINVNDKITQELIPDLKYYKWQYNIPIDYDTLKYILFQTNQQKKFLRETEQSSEAEKILSQEYLICIHPEPKYILWAVKRIIMAWYANTELTKNIRKIKVLINQWRGKSDETFNKRNGILPMIVIYPRYGKTSAKIVMQILANYFVLYTNIAWVDSHPSYCMKINDLMYYTNGNIDLKLYFKIFLKNYKGTVENTFFDENLNKLKSASDILYSKN